MPNSASSGAATTARRLCRVARPPLHGFKAEARFDPRVRDTWEVAKSRISIDQSRWNEILAYAA
jgi:hypothetical protein